MELYDLEQLLVPTENTTTDQISEQCNCRNWFEIWSLKVFTHLETKPPVCSPGLQTTLQPLLAVLAEAVHLGEVLGDAVLPVLLQVLLEALEQLGGAGLRLDPTSRQAGP